MRPYPESLAIAGAWGYIGRRFLDAAQRRRIRTWVLDPGEAPADIDLQSMTRVVDEAEFYGLPAEMFHLAMHPEQRGKALDLLLARPDLERLAILNEKPMAAPEDPQQCQRLLDAVAQSGALMLFDFPELFDPLTERILNHLAVYKNVQITDVYVRRGKDREDRQNPRNYKRIVPIQYQESVHCLAFVLYLLGRLRGNLDAIFSAGLTLRGEARPYSPPNPQIYPYVVDGWCSYHLALGPIRVDGQTDFKAGAEGIKQRVIVGSGDGRPFHIEVDFQEGRKRLTIDGMDQTLDPAANSYENVLRTYTRWRHASSREELMGQVYPNPAFARVAFQLSSVLWRCCHDRQPIHLATLSDLLAFDAGFGEAVPSLGTYAHQG